MAARGARAADRKDCSRGLPGGSISPRLCKPFGKIQGRSDGKREAKPVLTGLNRPNGIVFHNGTLYIAELSQISKVEKHRRQARPNA